MSQRYLLAIADRPRSLDVLAQLSSFGLDMLFSSDRVLVLGTRLRCMSVGETGCILGTVFHRHGPSRPVDALSVSEVSDLTSNDRYLERFWGGYIAIATNGRSTRVMRDPSGTFPCYYGRVRDVALFASDAELLELTGVSVEIDPEEVGRQLYRAFVPSSATALRGISELLAGSSVSISDDFAIGPQEPCWSPWDYVNEPNVEREETAERLARIVRHCVAAWAVGRGRLLLSVSGGLDSSIIAACLARSAADTVCLTMFSEDPAGDERPFARALCSHLGIRLIERPYRLEDVDIAQALAPHLPRPRDRTQANAYERVHVDVAKDVGADTFVTGNGGDNVFGYSQSAAPIADRFLAHGIDRQLFSSLRDVCEQTGCSIVDALRHALRLVRCSPAHQVRPNTLFLAPDFVARLGSAELRHAWLEAPADALPGKAAHIATILRVQPNIEASRGYHLPVLSPLLSQPIVETCLRVPSWEWRAGGRDRSLARRAFEDDLPAALINRRVKGTPSRFAARLLDHVRRRIRERLLGGRLASAGIIDALAVEQVLVGDRPVGDLERVRILELVNAEAWLDHWAARRKPAEAVETHIKSDGHDRPRASGDPIP